MSRNSIQFIGAAIAVFMWPTTAFAQPPVEDQAAADVAAAQAATASGALVRSEGLVERTGFAPANPVFQLSTTSDKTEVSVGLSTNLGRTRSTRVGDADRRVTTTTRFSLRGTAPINDDGEDTFVNLANPLSGSRLTLGVTQYRSRYVITAQALARARTTLNEAFSNCVQRNVFAWVSNRTPEERQVATEYLNAFSAAMLAGEGTGPAIAELVIGDLVQRFPSLPVEVREACRIGATETGPANNEDLIARYGDAARARDVIEAMTGNAPTWFYGVEGSISHNNFSFLDRTTFTTSDVDRSGYQATLYTGIIGGTGTWSLRAAASHGRSYRAQSSVELCQPVPNTQQSQCLSGPDGPPTRRKTTVLSAEGRLLFGGGTGLVPNLGIAPEFAYDFESDEYSVDVPIYFISNNENALTGGIRVGYNSEDNDVSFGVFVGVPFNILN